MNNKIKDLNPPKKLCDSSTFTLSNGVATSISDFKNNKERQISEEALQRVLNRAKELDW